MGADFDWRAERAAHRDLEHDVGRAAVMATLQHAVLERHPQELADVQETTKRVAAEVDALHWDSDHRARVESWLTTRVQRVRHCQELELALCNQSLSRAEGPSAEAFALLKFYEEKIRSSFQKNLDDLEKVLAAERSVQAEGAVRAFFAQRQVLTDKEKVLDSIAARDERESTCTNTVLVQLQRQGYAVFSPDTLKPISLDDRTIADHLTHTSVKTADIPQGAQKYARFFGLDGRVDPVEYKTRDQQDYDLTPSLIEKLYQDALTGDRRAQTIFTVLEEGAFYGHGREYLSRVSDLRNPEESDAFAKAFARLYGTGPGANALLRAEKEGVRTAPPRPEGEYPKPLVEKIGDVLALAGTMIETPRLLAEVEAEAAAALRSARMTAAVKSVAELVEELAPQTVSRAREACNILERATSGAATATSVREELSGRLRDISARAQALSERARTLPRTRPEVTAEDVTTAERVLNEASAIQHEIEAQESQALLETTPRGVAGEMWGEQLRQVVSNRVAAVRARAGENIDPSLAQKLSEYEAESWRLANKAGELEPSPPISAEKRMEASDRLKDSWRHLDVALDGFEREQLARSHAAAPGAKSWGGSDVAVRRTLRLTEKDKGPDIGYTLADGRALIAEAKGKSINVALDQIEVGIRQVRAGNVPAVTQRLGDYDLRIYVRRRDFEELQATGKFPDYRDPVQHEGGSWYVTSPSGHKVRIFAAELAQCL